MIEVHELSEVASVFNGKTPSKIEQRARGFPVLKIRDVTEHGQFVGYFRSFVDAEFAASFPTKLIREGDTLILNAAHNADYVASKIYCAQSKVAGSLATGEWLIIRPITGRLNAKYLHYWIKIPHVKSSLKAMVKGIHLYPKDVDTLGIPVPPLDEQERIAAQLDKADRLRRSRRYVRELSDSFLQSVFLEMFGDPVTNQKGWPVYPLEELCDGKYGVKAGPFGSSIKKEMYTRSGFRVYGQEQVIGGSFDIGDYYISTQKFAEMSAYEVRTGDVLVSLVGTIGKTLVVSEGIERGIINPRLVRITPKNEALNPYYLSDLIQHPAVQDSLIGEAHGSTMGVLNATLLKSLRVPLPPMTLQERYVAVVQKVKRLKRQQTEANRQAEHLFQTLLHQAFSDDS